jgi:hypothetical protein
MQSRAQGKAVGAADRIAAEEQIRDLKKDVDFSNYLDKEN